MENYGDEDQDFNNALKNANDDFGFDVGAFGEDGENFNNEGRKPDENREEEQLIGYLLPISGYATKRELLAEQVK